MIAIELITDVLRDLGVIDAYQDPSSEDATLCLRSLNALMLTMKADTIDLGYYSLTDVNDELPLSEQDCASIRPIFAMALTVSYPSAEVPQTLPFMAANSHSRLLLNAVMSNAQPANLADTPMRTGRRSNILTG